MFTPNVFADMERSEREGVQRALATLATSSIFERQDKTLLEQLVAGSAAADDDSLVSQVKDYRLNHQKLLELQHVGLDFVKLYEKER